MHALEKILQEILQEINVDCDVPFFATEAEGRAFIQGKATQANEDRRIIRSHMEDDGWMRGCRKKVGHIGCLSALHSEDM